MAIKPKDPDLDRDLVFEQEGVISTPDDDALLPYYCSEQEDDLGKGETAARVKKFFDFLGRHVWLPWLRLLTKRIGAAEGSMDNLKTKIDKDNEAFMTQVREGFAGVDQRLSGVDQRLSGMEEVSEQAQQAAELATRAAERATEAAASATGKDRAGSVTDFIQAQPLYFGSGTEEEIAAAIENPPGDMLLIEEDAEDPFEAMEEAIAELVEFRKEAEQEISDSEEFRSAAEEVFVAVDTFMQNSAGIFAATSMENAKISTNLNDEVAGICRINGNTQNVPFGTANGIVVTICDGGNREQICLNILSHYMAERSYNGVAWSEWGYYNPPIAVSSEFATMEFFANPVTGTRKRIYKTAINVGSIEKGKTVDKAHNLNVDVCVSAELIDAQNGRALNHGHGICCYAGKNNMTVRVDSDAALEVGRGVVVLKYTKEG